MLSIDMSAARDYCKKGSNILKTSVSYTIAGTQYTTAPGVTFSGGGGTGAAGTSVIQYGSVVGVNLSNNGSGYTSAPTVNFANGDAAGTAVLSDTGVIKSISIDTGGTGYTNGTHALVFTGGGGTGATGTATIAGGIVTGVTLSTGGSNYLTAPGISLSNTAGAGNGAFAAHATIGRTVASINLTNGGGTLITFTDNTVYVSPDARNVVNITVYDRFSSKPKEVQITSGSNTVTMSIGGLNPYDGLDAIATVLSQDGNIKDGSTYDMYTLHPTSGVFTMEL